MKTPKSPKKSQVRIISGIHRGRLISFVDAEGLRPTPDRLRETLFNWLMGHLVDAHVLDVCAGSGVLGFECLSRGASHTTFIEPNTAQANTLKDNANTLRLTTQATIINATAQTTLPKLTTPFDVIFVDPPYSLALWQTLFDQLTPLCHEQTLIYIEGDRPFEDMLPQGGFNPLKSTKVGQIYAYLGQNNPCKHTQN